MAPTIPNRFLFKFEFPLHRCKAAPRIDGRVEDWDENWRLPALHGLDGEKGFADLYATWNEEGLFLGVAVRGKKKPPRCEPQQFWKSDNVRLMTDMRDTRNIRRATRFCQHFYFLPCGGGRDGRAAVAGADKVQRATANAPLPAAGVIPVASNVSRGGYSLTAHVPGAVLHGFDPGEHPRIGIMVMVEDSELGRQSLTVGDDLNWFIDPSTWPTAVLGE
ncbi:MAG TPA: hypothetical protein VNT79_02555 [Phycisphaerae bacterium]|nr:hypothetical protein [Phycisphaerae bacterium]